MVYSTIVYEASTMVDDGVSLTPRTVQKYPFRCTRVTAAEFLKPLTKRRAVDRSNQPTVDSGVSTEVSLPNEESRELLRPKISNKASGAILRQSRTAVAKSRKNSKLVEEGRTSKDTNNEGQNTKKIITGVKEKKKTAKKLSVYALKKIRDANFFVGADDDSDDLEKK